MESSSSVFPPVQISFSENPIQAPRLLFKDIKSIVDKNPPPWGPLGYIVYKRTYARQIVEKNRSEEWHETLLRVVNGLQEIAELYDIPPLTLDEMIELYSYMYNMKGLVSGRALWQLGTKTIKKIGGASLNNCWFITLDSIDSFLFLFDMLMLGGGVGFSVRKEDVAQTKKLEAMQGVYILEKPQDINQLFKKYFNS